MTNTLASSVPCRISGVVSDSVDTIQGEPLALVRRVPEYWITKLRPHWTQRGPQQEIKDADQHQYPMCHLWCTYHLPVVRCRTLPTLRCISKPRLSPELSTLFSFQAAAVFNDWNYANSACHGHAVSGRVLPGVSKANPYELKTKVETFSFSSTDVVSLQIFEKKKSFVPLYYNLYTISLQTLASYRVNKLMLTQVVSTIDNSTSTLSISWQCLNKQFTLLSCFVKSSKNMIVMFSAGSSYC